MMISILLATFISFAHALTDMAYEVKAQAREERQRQEQAQQAALRLRQDARRTSVIESATRHCQSAVLARTCQFLTVTSFSYDPNIASYYAGDAFFDAVRLMREGFRIVEDMGSIQCGGAGSHALQNSVESLTAFADEHDLPACKRACLALCMSATTLVYDSNAPTLVSVCDLAASGRGICGDFTTMADYYAEHLNVEGNTQYAVMGNNDKIAPHAFMDFHFGGKRYYAEPQRDSCTFYEY